MSTSQSISGTAITGTGPITGPITDTGAIITSLITVIDATITGHTGGIIQGV